MALAYVHAVGTLRLILDIRACPNESYIADRPVSQEGRFNSIEHPEQNFDDLTSISRTATYMHW